MILICVIGLALLAGCAHSRSQYYYPDGKLCADIKQYILGAGEVERKLIIAKCGVVESHKTKGTGVSENFSSIPGDIVEGGLKGIIRGFKPL